jgi:hypothetical protein
MLVYGSESEKKVVDPNPKKMSSDPQHWVKLVNLYKVLISTLSKKLP